MITPAADERHRQKARGAIRLAATLVAGALLLVSSATAATAHAFLAGSNPSDGQVLTSAPTQLRFDFSESVVLSATKVDIVDGNGRHVIAERLRLVPSSEAGDIESPVQVVADLPTLTRNTYRISWETLSSDDLHRTSGTLVFGIQHAVTATKFTEPPPRADEALLRWVVLLGISLALGGLLTSRLLGRAGGRSMDREIRRSESLSAAGSLVAATTAALLLLAQLVSGGQTVGQVFLGSYGVRWSLRETGLLLLLVATLSRRRRGTSTLGLLVLMSGTALTCTGTALLGHSGTALPGHSGALLGMNVTRVVATALHVGAATTWAGGIVVLSLVLLRRRSHPAAANGHESRLVLRRFGVYAAACVSVMVVSGVYLSSHVIGSVDAALLTTYGRLLMLKVSLAALAGGLALANAVRLHRSRSGTARGSIIAEGWVALGLLGFSAFLTSGQPAMEPQLVRTTSAATAQRMDRTVADLQQGLSIRPNQPGTNVALVDVFDTRRPALGPVRQVMVSVQGAGGSSGPLIPADRLRDGRWSASVELPLAAESTVSVVVRRSGLPDVTTGYNWIVGTPSAGTRSPWLSTTPVIGFLQILAGGLLALVTLTWTVAVIRWRRLAALATTVRLGRSLGRNRDQPDGHLAGGSRQNERLVTLDGGAPGGPGVGVESVRTDEPIQALQRD